MSDNWADIVEEDEEGPAARTRARGAAVAAAGPVQGGAAVAEPVAEPAQGVAAQAAMEEQPGGMDNATQFPPALEPLRREQERVNALVGEARTDYLNAAKERMPLSATFTADHGDIDSHAALHILVVSMIRQIKNFSRCHRSYEGRTLVLAGTFFGGAAAQNWDTIIQTEEQAAEGNGIGEESVVYRSLRALLRLYSDPVAHETMQLQLSKLAWDPRGVAFNRAAWSKLMLAYDKVVGMTRHLPAASQLPEMTWAAWLADFKKRLPQWARKAITERPEHYNDVASFWVGLAKAEPARGQTGLRAMPEAIEATVPWRQAAFNMFQEGNLELAQAFLDADGHEDELPPVTATHLHAMASGAPLMASNGRPLRCWTCQGNHRRADCDGSGPLGPGGRGGPGAPVVPRRETRPPQAPALFDRPGLNAVGQTYVSGFTRPSTTSNDADLRASVHSLTMAVEAQGAQLQSVLAALATPSAPSVAGLHQLGATATLAGPHVMVAASAPDGYVQVGRSNLASGEEVPVWATESALQQGVGSQGNE